MTCVSSNQCHLNNVCALNSQPIHGGKVTDASKKTTMYCNPKFPLTVKQSTITAKNVHFPQVPNSQGDAGNQLNLSNKPKK